MVYFVRRFRKERSKASSVQGGGDYAEAVRQQDNLSQHSGHSQSNQYQYQPRPQPSFMDNIGFYPDQHFDGYESQMSDDPPPPKDNGIRDWKVGDIAIHEVFGRGVVVAIIDGTILQIEFEEHGRKSILATHPKISKESKGAIA